MSISRFTVADGLLAHNRATLRGHDDTDIPEHDYRSLIAHLTAPQADLLLRALTTEDRRSSPVPANVLLSMDSGLVFRAGSLSVVAGRVIADVYGLWCEIDDHEDCGRGHLFEQDADLGAVEAWRTAVLPLTLALAAMTHAATPAAA